MKRIILILVAVSFIATLTYGADTKTSALTADTSPGLDSLIMTVDDPAGTPASRKSTVGETLNAAPAMDSSGDIVADYVDDTMLDFGAGAGQIDAADLPIKLLGSPTYTTLEEYINTTNTAGYVNGGFNITDDGDGTITVAAGKGFVRTTDAVGGQLTSFDMAQSTPNLTDHVLNYVYFDYNAGTPQVVSATALGDIDHHTEFVLGLVRKDGNSLHISQAGQALSCFNYNVYYHAWEHDGLERSGGAVLTETGTRNIAVSAGTFWLAYNRSTTSAFDSSGADNFVYVYRDGGGAWTEVAAQSAIDNANYDDGDGTLGVLTVNRYGVAWVFQLVDGDVYVVYGQGDYVLAAAEGATVPSSLPDELSDPLAVFIGKIIVQQGASSFTEITIPLESSTGLSAVTDHGALDGLGDDDHSQYEDELTNSAGVAAAVDDETGTGVLMFGTSPTVTTNINLPKATFTDADAAPSAVGELLYDNTVTGFIDGLMCWYDDDAVRYILDTPTLPTVQGQLMEYNATSDQMEPTSSINLAFRGATAEALLRDSDAAGADDADEDAASIKANMSTTTEDAEVSDVWATYFNAGAEQSYMFWDASDFSLILGGMTDATTPAAVAGLEALEFDFDTGTDNEVTLSAGVSSGVTALNVTGLTLQDDGAAYLVTDVATIGDINGGTAEADAFDFGGAGSVEIPNGTSGTTDATGEIYLDTNGDTTNMTGPVLQISTNDATLGYLFPIAALPQAGSEDNYIMKYDSTGKTIQFEADSGAAGGDSISIDSVAVVDPDFVSTGDIDFVDTSNTVTGNINADAVTMTKIDDDGNFTDLTGNWTTTGDLTGGTLKSPGSASDAGYMRLLEDTDNGANYIEVSAPAAISANSTLTLPEGTRTIGYQFSSIAVADLSVTITPSVLTTEETTNVCVSNYKGTGADHVFTMPAAHAAGNIIFSIGDEFQVDIEPNTGDLFYLNGTAMAANEHIQNTADTLGERIVGYCVNINGTLRWMFYSSDTAWVEETP